MTDDYRLHELLKADQPADYEYPQKLQVSGRDGMSHHLNITHDEFTAIVSLLTENADEDDDEPSFTLDDAIERLDDTYTLIYVARDDQLGVDQVEMLVSGDYEALYESTSEWENEAQFDAANSIIENEFSEEEIDAIQASDDYDELRYAIYNRDQSDWLSELIEHTPNPLLRITAIDEDNAFSFEEVSTQQVLAKLQIESTDHNKKVIDAALLEASPEYSVLLGYWVCSLDLATIANAAEDDSFVIVNPHLYLGNPVMGSGWLTEEPLHATITVKREDLHTDAKAFGYSLDSIYGGLSASQFVSEVTAIPNPNSSNDKDN